MKIFLEEDNVNLVQSIASASTLISSLAGIAEDYIISMFPNDFFKSIYIDTSQTINEQKRNRNYNKNLNKKEYPSLSITPELSLDDPIGGMEKNPFISSPNLFLKREMNRNYNIIAIDPDKKFSIYFTSDYITTNFNFKIVTNSFVQNSDMAFFLKSNFQEDFFQYLNEKYITTEIPKTFINIISQLKNFNLNDSRDLRRLELYLYDIGRQEQNIEKKNNLMTGKTSFFLNIKSNILTLFSDLDCPPSIIRENQTEGEYTINFKFQVSSWLTNAFLMSINKDVFKKIELENVLGEEQDSGFYTISLKNKKINRSKVINFFDKFGEKQIGQNVASEMFTKELNTNFQNIKIDFLKNMKNDFLNVFAYAEDKLNKKQLSQLFKIKITTGYGELDEDIDFKVGKHLQITILKNINSDFIIDFYLNRSLFESLKKAKKMDTLFINNNVLTTMIIRTSEIEDVKKVPVYRFSNTREEFDSSLEKSFRVKTSYGLGYISLENYDKRKKNSDLYKICVGYDKENEPILKFLEIKDPN